MWGRRLLVVNTPLFALEGSSIRSRCLDEYDNDKINDVRLVGVARGEQEYFDPSGIPTATEGCKSNALMRCCKDLGIASELWSVGEVFSGRTNLIHHISTQTGIRDSFASSRQSTV